MLRYLFSRTHKVSWENKKKEKEKKNDAQPIFIRPRHNEILCMRMKHGFECLIASQMIISSFLFSQN